MNQFNNSVDEDYQDAASTMIAEHDCFDNIDAVVTDEEVELDAAVDLLYNAVYG